VIRAAPALVGAVLGLGGLAAAGCGRPAAVDASSAPAGRDASGTELLACDGGRAMAEVEALVALGPRVAGTAGAARAATHLQARFAALGLAVEIDAFEDETPSGPSVFRNVIARLPGRGGEEVIVVGSHYDTKGGIADDFAGANDSGSSTGLLLELARVCRDAAGPRGWDATLVFVAFDGEECAVRYGPRDGFHGSRHYVRQLQQAGRTRQVRAMILTDMIGDRDLRVTLPRNSSTPLKTLALDAAAQRGVRHLFGLYPGQIGDDHVAFLQAGIPAIVLIDFAYGSAPGRNDYWHTSADTLDKLSPDSLQAVGDVVLHMIDTLQTQPDLLQDSP
jgi:glutaminyl-peptide cyclotransferase